jgi:hypothetical protein
MQPPPRRTRRRLRVSPRRRDVSDGVRSNWTPARAANRPNVHRGSRPARLGFGGVADVDGNGIPMVLQLPLTSGHFATCPRVLGERICWGDSGTATRRCLLTAFASESAPHHPGGDFGTWRFCSPPPGPASHRENLPGSASRMTDEGPSVHHRGVTSRPRTIAMADQSAPTRRSAPLVV